MRLPVLLRAGFTLLAALLLSIDAHAQLFRAYVSVDGSDANPCTLPQPCRLVPAALAAVANRGEIWMLDSANYNASTVTIGKSVTILAVPGALGSLVANGGPAISITAANLLVTLRNVVIVPLAGGTGTHGIHLTGASQLVVEDSVIANMTNGNGILAAGTGLRIDVNNTTFRGTPLSHSAIQLRNGAKAAVTRSTFTGCAYALSAGGSNATSTVASLTDSVISGGDTGVFVQSTHASAIVSVEVSRSTITGMAGAAIDAEASGGTAEIVISGSVITRSYYGWLQSGTGSVIRTLGNNHIANNNNEIGSLTTASLQ